MTAKSGSGKKSGNARRSTGAGAKDRLIVELKNRIAALERESGARQDANASAEIAGHRNAEIYPVKGEADLSLSQKIAHIGSWRWDEATGRNEWSDEFYRILGFEPGSVKPSGKLYMSMVHPDDREMVIGDAAKALAENRPGSLDYRIIRRDGEIRHVHVEIPRMLRDKRGVLLGEFGTIQDITERKIVEKSLKFERLQLLSIFDSIDEVIYVADPYTHEILYANRAMQDKFGKSLTGGICYREIQNKDAPCEFCTNGIILRDKGKPYRWEFHNPTVSRDFDIVDRIIQWPDGRDVRFEIALDVTERRRTEKALIRDRYILTKSQEVARVGNWALNLETGKLTGSAENSRIFGYRPGEVEPTIEWLLSRVLPEDRAAMIVFIEAGTRDGARGSIDYRIRKPDRSLGYVNTIIDKVVRDGSGKITRLYGISQDITERKRVEDELKAAKLEAELYLDLMGHDINNMHQIAMGYLEMARDMPQCGDQAALLDKSEEVLKRSTKLIGNVRKLQMLQEGVFPTRKMDVCKVISNVHSEYEAVPGKTIKLNTNGCETCIVHANELLHDVIANLVNNAIKHTRDGEEITINLDVTGDSGQRYCRVAVEDNGPGIPDDHKERIFDRMQKGTARGMGIGLYLVRALVESYGGMVWVEDRVPGDPAKGARFVVTLPAA